MPNQQLLLSLTIDPLLQDLLINLLRQENHLVVGLQLVSNQKVHQQLQNLHTDGHLNKRLPLNLHSLDYQIVKSLHPDHINQPHLNHTDHLQQPQDPTDHQQPINHTDHQLQQKDPLINHLLLENHLNKQINHSSNSLLHLNHILAHLLLQQIHSINRE